MAQQTAVDWLWDRYNNGNDYEKHITEIEYKQAKQMEKQQLANSWDKACDQYIYRDGDLVKVWKDFDKYYNETYESNNRI